MPCRTKEAQAASSKKHYLANKVAFLARVRSYTAKNRVLLKGHVAQLKSNATCVDCKKAYPACVFDFDHVKGKKRGDVATMVGRSVSLKTLIAEIEKCELVCANCHRIRTHNRKISVRQLSQVTADS